MLVMARAETIVAFAAIVSAVVTFLVLRIVINTVSNEKVISVVTIILFIVAISAVIVLVRYEIVRLIKIAEIKGSLTLREIDAEWRFGLYDEIRALFIAQ